MKKADRMREVEDPDNVVLEKCKKLASYLRNSKCTLVYTGAGISTAASIPDYRGPNGVWTLAEKGIAHSKCGDPIECCPTTSHMVLKEFCRRGIIRHILSQNCDGLHLRSGLPQKMLSEIHGNMHIEVCTHCDPPRQFIRPFDVTQKSQFRRHGTGRACTVCNTELVDTIVHFGEVGRVPWPLNWKGVTSLIDECDLIVCVGTSLAVLKQYQFLWPKAKGQTQIAIVNLQWTPKDRSACLKINARCDTVFEKLAKLFSVPVSYYCRDCDPVLNPRRNARICELMERITDCRCHLRVPRSTCDEQGPRGTPGWWAVGIQRTMKRSLQTPSNQKKRSVGRPRKRKKSCAVSRGVYPDEEVVVEKNNSSDTKFSSYNESTAVICAISELDMRSVHGSHLNQFLNASAEGVVESDGGNRLEVKVHDSEPFNSGDNCDLILFNQQHAKNDTLIHSLKVGESDEELIVGCKVEWKSVRSCLTALIDEVSALQ